MSYIIRNRSLIAIVVVILSFFNLGSAGEEHRYQLQVDWVRYKTPQPDSLIYVELYYSLDRGKLDYRLAENKWQANSRYKFHISDIAGNAIDSIEHDISVVLEGYSNPTRSYTVFDKIPLLLSAGKYKFKISFCSTRNSECDSISDVIIVDEFSTDSLALSDLYLVADLSTPEDAGAFTKRGMDLLPNVSRIYGYDPSMLYFYLEIYNLELPDDSLEDVVYEVRFSVLNNDGMIFREFEPVQEVVNSADTYTLQGFNVMGFPEGTYYLKVEIIDEQTDVSREMIDEFFVQKEIYREFSEEDAAIWRNVIYYLANSSELANYDNLSLAGKQEFLKSFWGERDTLVETLRNEYKEAYLARWEYVNQEFGEEQGLPGWHTDMGRIFLIHGAPDDVTRSEFSMASQAWERWDYFDVQGGVFFIFVDTYNLGSFELVHSNAEGEVQDFDWYEDAQRSHPTFFDSEQEETWR